MSDEDKARWKVAFEMSIDHRETSTAIAKIVENKIGDLLSVCRGYREARRIFGPLVRVSHT